MLLGILSLMFACGTTETASEETTVTTEVQQSTTVNESGEESVKDVLRQLSVEQKKAIEASKTNDQDFGDPVSSDQANQFNELTGSSIQPTSNSTSETIVTNPDGTTVTTSQTYISLESTGQSKDQ